MRVRDGRGAYDEEKPLVYVKATGHVTYLPACMQVLHTMV